MKEPICNIEKPDKAARQGPLGDVIPGDPEADNVAQRGQPPEPVEDRPMVGKVKPEDYPEEDRKRSTDF